MNALSLHHRRVRPRGPACPVLIRLAVLLVAGAAAPRLTAGIPEPDLVWYGKVLTSSGGSTVRLTTGTLRWQIDPPGGGSPWVLTTPLTNINDQYSFVLRVPCESPEPGVTASAGAVVLVTPPGTYGRLTVTLDGQPLGFGSPQTFSPTLADRGTAERIDLTLGTAPVDSDGDGMSDAWELQFFGSTTGANPNDDPDGDGLSNLREFRAGTNPKDAQSVFEVVDVSPVANGVRIRWSSVAGKIYRVRRAASLLTSPTAYAVLQSDIPATAPLNELVDTTVAGGKTFFYLIEVQP